MGFCFETQASTWPAFAFLHNLFPSLLKANDDASNDPFGGNVLLSMYLWRLQSLKLRCHSQWSWPWVHDEGE
ncbi:hypothetical protein HN51_043868 [Arachis hypogaea]